MTAAQTLLEALEFADGDQLLVLLEAENLLIVLEHHGRDRAQLRQELASGASPGKLLLSLFREGHTADDLMALLPTDALAKVKARAAAKEAASAPRPSVANSGAAPPSTSASDSAADARLPQGGSGRSIPYALIAYLIALVVPSMLVSGALPDWTISISTGVACAAIGAGVAGLFASSAWPLRVGGAIAGLLSAPGAVVLTAIWLALRGSVLRIEIALTVILGALPGVLFFVLAQKLYRRIAKEAR